MNEWIKQEIVSFVENDPENTLHDIDEPAWKSPIVTVTDGRNPLFYQYKDLIGDFYWYPDEILKKKYPEKDFDRENISIVVWVLPQTDQTREDQRMADKLPSDRWIMSRHYGEFFNEKVRRYVEGLFAEKGIEAVAPAVFEDFAYQQSPKFGLASNWSERHTAYAAGLGTFALCDGFITEVGKAVRIGSCVVYADIEKDNLPVKELYGNCLFHSKGICGVCGNRCPVGAITKEEKHDKQLCFNYIRNVTAPHAEKVLGAFQTPCGLCQARVPCEFRNPMARKTG